MVKISVREMLLTSKQEKKYGIFVIEKTGVPDMSLWLQGPFVSFPIKLFKNTATLPYTKNLYSEIQPSLWSSKEGQLV